MLGGGGGEAEGGSDNLASHGTGNCTTLVGVFGEEEINNARNGEDGDRGSAGSRWPRQETLALLKIRSDMDVAFRDSNLKGPLWDDVSRKMAEMGYQRSAKKCREKFENVYKYHKRTKEGRSTKSIGKTYRFFEQLEAIYQLQPFQMPPPPPPASKAPPFHPPGPLGVLQTPTTISFAQKPCNNINPSTVPANPSNVDHLKLLSATNFMVSTSSTTSSDDFQAQRRGGKKRKWKDFVEKLMRDVVEKQEELQTKFLRTIEMRGRERSLREESWRMQEMARLNRQHEILVQERSAAAAKDAAVIAFLQNISDQQPQGQQNQLPQPMQNTPPPPPLQPRPVNVVRPDHNGGDNNKAMMVVSSNTTPPSSSRWPKAEIEALIKLRTSFEIKYQENGQKGPFWEEISAGMGSLGYTRNAKRCKEKWENINKYFKKVKESNKQRPEDSKTCPYYHLLDAIYKEKKASSGGEKNLSFQQLPSANSSMEPLMVQPEQQWPLAPQALAHQDQNKEEQDDMLDEDELDQDMEDDDEDDDDETETKNNSNNNNNGGTFEVVSNYNPQHAASSAATGSNGTAVP